MGNFVGRDGDDSDTAERNDRQRDGVVAGEDRESLGYNVEHFGDLRNVAAGFFYAGDIGDFAQAARVAGSMLAEVRPGTL